MTNSNSSAKDETIHPNFWQRYKNSINFKSDLKTIFISDNPRYAVLDGVRALTILGMILFHVLYGVVRLLDDEDRIQTFIQSFPDYLDWMWLAQGSDPLFVVCGLLVSYSCFREYDKTKTIDVVRFYEWRLLRIYPLYLLAILIFLPTNSHNPSYLISNLLFASNFFASQRTIVPVGWSLDVQMQFYALLPFICFIMYALRWRIIFLVSLCVAAVLYRYWLVHSQPELYETPFYMLLYSKDFGRLLADQLYYDLDARIAAFLFGMLAAYCHHYYGKTLTNLFTRYPVLNLTILSLGLGLIWWSFSFSVVDQTSDFYQPFSPTANMIFLAFSRYGYSLGMSIMLVMILCPVGLSRIFVWFCSWRIWHPFAQLIYPLYLFHFPFIVVGAAVWFRSIDKDSITMVSALDVFGIYAWAVLFTVIFSIFCHIYIEKPFIAMREKMHMGIKTFKRYNTDTLKK